MARGYTIYCSIKDENFISYKNPTTPKNNINNVELKKIGMIHL